MRHLTAAAALAVFLASSGLQGQAAEDHSSDHSMMHGHEHGATMSVDAPTMPTEPGQSAFGAIAEIVEMLSNDPQTDWSKVDIDGLRRHLVDMNELTLNASAETSLIDNGIVFRITGDGRTLHAIQTMVPAHADELSRTTPWRVSVEITDSGAVMTILTDSPAELTKLKALGFFGVMATGSHHQMHHLQMALGGGHVH